MLLLALERLRARFQAVDTVRFAEGMAGNTIRGALGTRLASNAFAPKSAGGPSGLADPPRPFVVRASRLDGQVVEAGAAFSFDIHLFASTHREEFHHALGQLDRLAGGRIHLLTFDGEPIAIDTAPSLEARRVSIDFTSPAELKSGERIAERPEFPVLFARLRDRISTLRSLYGPGPLDIDFRVMADRAAGVTMSRCDIRTVERTRRSTRTGRSHSIGGFTGHAEYEGDLTEFIPYLRAGEWTGVGRQTTWGKGAYRVEFA